MSGGKLLMCVASLTLFLCGHHLLHAYHGPRLKDHRRDTVYCMCSYACVCVSLRVLLFTLINLHASQSICFMKIIDR